MISIITASYNNGSTIVKTIESILNQSQLDFEFIIIDGNSNDNTVDIIKTYETNFKNKKISFKWISEPDNGIYEAWNKGIKLANRQWVCFIGTDDILMKDYIKTYSKFIENNNNLEYISSIVHVIKNDKIIRVIDEGWDWDLFKRNMDIGHVGSLHNMNLYKRLGLYDERLKIVGDYDLLLRAKNTLKAGYINKLTVRMGADGISSNNLLLALKETKYIKIKHKTVSKLQSNIDLLIMFSKVILNRIKLYSDFNKY